MTEDSESPAPRVVDLPAGLGHCRHGREVQRVTAERSVSGWLVWGHYACEQCECVAFHYVREPPDEALIGSRRLPITRP